MSDTLVRYLNRHIVSVVSSMPGYAGYLPGGIHRQVAPPNTAYPFLTMELAGGNDKYPLDTVGLQVVSGGLLILLKVHDLTADETNSAAAYLAVTAALSGGNNSGISGAYCTGREETPVDLPVVDGDNVYQQIGGTWRYWIDPITP
jgi:hypothetical protein